MYNIGLLKFYFKIKNGTIPLYFHNFLVTENVPVEPQRNNFRHKRRVIIPIPPREYLKRNTSVCEKFQTTRGKVAPIIFIYGSHFSATEATYIKCL